MSDRRVNRFTQQPPRGAVIASLTGRPFHDMLYVGRTGTAQVGNRVVDYTRLNGGTWYRARPEHK
jgi:hypothetical protein